MDVLKNTIKWKSISIIGIGTIGGFLAESLLDVDGLQDLSLMDYDIVEERNIERSIYSKQHIGWYKTDAIKDILLRKLSTVRITTINNKFEDMNHLSLKDKMFLSTNGMVPYEKSELVIDCRDEICTRSNGIDVRLYISSRYLIIDCRKGISYDDEKVGKYVSGLTKTDIKHLSYSFIHLLLNGFVGYLMKEQIVHQIELDYLDKILEKVKIEEETATANNAIPYYGLEESNKLLNLKRYIPQILEQNKTKDIILCVGDKTNPIAHQKINKNNIKDINDVLPMMLSMVNTPSLNYFYYIVSVQANNNNCFVELLPETGSA